ncbi:hypothetical protein IJG90_03650 [Candidatus Saccharibacteria bacterium]|nr:hypothetical protein [Candidatus Saccharibacteria bacterium]
MAINIVRENYQNNDGMDAVSIEVANGDLKALRGIAHSYRLNDVADVIAFAIGILDKAHGQPVAVVDEDGHYIKYKPADSLRRDDDTTISA